jgi:hypothetical protein
VVFCCGCRSKLGRHQNGGYWLLDVVRGQANPRGIERLLRDTATLDGKRVRIGFGKDPWQAGNGQALHLARRQYGLYNIDSDSCKCRLLKRSAMPNAITLRSRMNAPNEHAINPAPTAIWGASAGAMPGTRWRNWWLNWPAPSCAPTSI